MNWIVTDCAPSSTLRAKHVHRWAWTFGKIMNTVLAFVFYLVPLIFSLCFPYVCARMCYAVDPENKNGWRTYLSVFGKITFVGSSLCIVFAALFQNDEIWNSVCLTISGYLFIRFSRIRVVIPAWKSFTRYCSLWESIDSKKRTIAYEYLWSQKPKPYGAEPGATANEHACHGLCSEQHTPRQARSSLSLNVRQN
jgi:hypothetical protein